MASSKKKHTPTGLSKYARARNVDQSAPCSQVGCKGAREREGRPRTRANTCFVQGVACVGRGGGRCCCRAWVPKPFAHTWGCTCACQSGKAHGSGTVPGAAWVVVVGEGCVGGQSQTAVHGIDVPGRIVWLSRGVHSGCKGAARGTLGRARTMKLRWRECAVGPPGVVAPGQGVHPHSLVPRCPLGSTSTPSSKITAASDRRASGATCVAHRGAGRCPKQSRMGRAPSSSGT